MAKFLGVDKNKIKINKKNSQPLTKTKKINKKKRF